MAVGRVQNGARQRGMIGCLQMREVVHTVPGELATTVGVPWTSRGQ